MTLYEDTKVVNGGITINAHLHGLDELRASSIGT